MERKSVCNVSSVCSLLKWPLSISLALGIGFGFVYAVITIAGHVYDMRHPLAVGEDDLGVGLFALFVAAIATMIALPLVVFLTRFLGTILRRLLR